MQLTGSGIQGDGPLEGNEEALVIYSDDVSLDQLRHAVRSAGKASEQRVPFDLREEARRGLTDWWSDRLDTWFMNVIAGNTAETDAKRTGMQATSAPTSATGNTRILYADGGSTSEASLSASQTFQLSYIDRAVAVAKTASPLIRPIKVDGSEYYVMFLHPYQVHSLRSGTAAAGSWVDIQKAAMTGGKIKDNPIFTGALGVFNNVVLHESTRVPAAPTNANARRAVLCGAQSCALAFGQGHGVDQMQWYEELFDYGNQLGVEAGCIAGMKKLVYNATDFGTVVVSTWAVAP